MTETAQRMDPEARTRLHYRELLQHPSGRWFVQRLMENLRERDVARATGVENLARSDEARFIADDLRRAFEIYAPDDWLTLEAERLAEARHAEALDNPQNKRRTA